MKRLTLLVSVVLVFACLCALPAMAQSSNKAANHELLYHAWAGTVEGVAKLLQEGADVNATDYEMFTALEGAEGIGNTDVANFLIKHGADKKYYERRDEYGRTALMYRAQDGALESVKFLIAKGADVNAKDNQGQTALMYAVKPKYFSFNKDSSFRERIEHRDDRYLKIVKFLIEKGADVNARDKNGNTAVDLARLARVQKKLVRTIQATHLKEQVKKKLAKKQKDIAEQVKKAISKKK